MGLLSKADGLTSIEIAMGITAENSHESDKIDNLQPTNDLEKFLEQYNEINSSLRGMIINFPENLKNKDRMDLLSAMVSHFALVKELPSDRCLILFPGSYDQDLIAHRIKNNLKTEIPLIFSAGNTAEAIQKIKPYQ